MALHLITGYKGTAHITAEDVGAFNAGVIGSGEYVLNTGNKFAASMISNNTVKILDGDAVIQGRHISLKKDTYEELTINNGETGKNRNDLIVVRYTKDGSTGIENAVFAVIQGTSTEGKASDPEYTTGDILSGDCTLHEMPLYRIPLNGLTVGEPKALFEVSDTIGNATRKAEEALNIKGLTDKGVVPFSSIDEDIPEKWEELGTGIYNYNNDCEICIQGLETETGYILNLVGGGLQELAQIFITHDDRSSNKLYYRTGQTREYWISPNADHGKATPWTKIMLETDGAMNINSYSGNGNYGSSNKNEVTLDFEPRFGIVFRAGQFMFLHKHQSVSYFVDPTTDKSHPNTVNFLNDTVSWYSTSAEGQANSSGVYYFYAFFG